MLFRKEKNSRHHSGEDRRLRSEDDMAFSESKRTENGNCEEPEILNDRNSMSSSKSSFRQQLSMLILKIAICTAAVWVIVTFVAEPYRENGNDMFPSIKDGDLCIFYKLSEPYTGDIVLYESEDGRKKVGRIIAREGQVVDFPEEGGFLVNGYVPAEELPYDTYGAEETDVSFPIELQEDEYFVMNDYREHTNDGRETGAIRREAIRGKLIFCMRRRGF